MPQLRGKLAERVPGVEQVRETHESPCRAHARGFQRACTDIRRSAGYPTVEKGGCKVDDNHPAARVLCSVRSRSLAPGQYGAQRTGPDYTVRSLTGETYTRDNVIRAIEQQTDFGRLTVEAEASHVSDLLKQIAQNLHTSLSDERPI